MNRQQRRRLGLQRRVRQMTEPESGMLCQLEERRDKAAHDYTEFLVWLYQDGVPTREIGAVLGRAPESVLRTVRRYRSRLLP